MKKLKILILSIIILLLSGCSQKNPAYEGLQESPCSCFEIKKEKINV